MAIPISQTSNLSDIYPDTCNQLCNKHVKRLSYLKTLFSDIYDQMEPEAFLLVNGVAKVVDLGNDLHLSFALQNGITVLYSKTYLNEAIFINGNHLQQEIVFNSKGKHEDGIHEKIDDIKYILKSIRKNSKKDKQFYGGIIYIHSNIGESHFGFNQCFVLAIAITLMLIQDQLNNYSKQTLINLISEANNTLSRSIVTNLVQKYELSKVIVQSCFIHTKSEHQISVWNPYSCKSINQSHQNEPVRNHNECSFKSTSTEDQYSPQSIESLEEQGSIKHHKHDQQLKSLRVNLKDNHKLVLCKLDVSKEQEQEYNRKITKMKNISDFIHEQGIHRNQLINERGSARVPESLQDIVKEDDYLIEYCQEVRRLLSELAHGKIQFEEFITDKYELDNQYHIFDEEITNILSTIQAQTKFLHNFCVIQGSTLLISMDKQYYAEIMLFLRKMLNENKLSTYKYLNTMHKTDNEPKPCDISEIMFTTMPSAGCAIYRPSEDAWI